MTFTGICPERLGAVNKLLNQYVDSGKYPGYAVLISKDNEEVAYYQGGMMDVERQKPIQRDTIYRIYSMTKPIVSVAMMQLFEQGHFQLSDPVYKYIPAWESLSVFDTGTAEDHQVKPASRHMTIKDLLIHTAGLTYGFEPENPVDQLYVSKGIYRPPPGTTLQQGIDLLSETPLRFDPGTVWQYSVATDVIGYLIEQFSGDSLEEYLQQHILEPLEMNSTAFSVNPAQAGQLASCYHKVPDQDACTLIDDATTSQFLTDPSRYSGGGGLLSTIDDYHKFCEAMLGKGERNGVRILGRKTVEFMTMNQLPGNVDLATMGQDNFSETTFSGVGFGLGFSVVMDPASAQLPSSVGEFGWGGLASTYFWVDPEESIIAIFMTQLIPSDSYPVRPELKTAVYQALVN